MWPSYVSDKAHDDTRDVERDRHAPENEVDEQLLLRGLVRREKRAAACGHCDYSALRRSGGPACEMILRSRTKDWTGVRSGSQKTERAALIHCRISVNENKRKMNLRLRPRLITLAFPGSLSFRSICAKELFEASPSVRWGLRQRRLWFSRTLMKRIHVHVYSFRCGLCRRPLWHRPSIVGVESKRAQDSCDDRTNRKEECSGAR